MGVAEARSTPQDLFDFIEKIQTEVATGSDRSERSRLGQFFTPAPIAELLASYSQANGQRIRLLDAGAGIGGLTAAWVARLASQQTLPEDVDVTLFELDERLVTPLDDVMRRCQTECEQIGVQFTYRVENTDFIRSAVDVLAGGVFAPAIEPFDCAILNPPYRKFASDSPERRLLRDVGIETGNLYAAFVALALRLLRDGGELIAITPRSFCNGPYFRPFRRELVRSSNITHIHVLDSRKAAFANDEVLQENVVFRVERGLPQQASVTVEWSHGGAEETRFRRDTPFDRVIRPGDPDAFIHVSPDEWDESLAQALDELPSSLAELGLQVSTGRVVEFRAREFLRADPERGSVPLLYPSHFYGQGIRWPGTPKKPNALLLTPETAELTNPGGVYVLVKRFSAKEERRRVVAVIVTPDSVPGELVAFENHLNYFHCGGGGISRNLAAGLSAYLNSTILDRYFRRFSGHTQVNATDLRKLPYPAASQLEELGRRTLAGIEGQEQLDELVEEEILSVPKKKRSHVGVVIRKKIAEASSFLTALGLPKEQQNERAALTLLALLDLGPGEQWSSARNPLRGVTPIMEFAASDYGKHWKPNTRESVRRFTLHQFEAAGLVVANPDKLDRPINSPAYCYQVPEVVLDLVRAFGSEEWEMALRKYLASAGTLVARYASEREMRRLPASVREGAKITLSPGGQNKLIQRILDDFCPLFTPGAEILYVGDAEKKFAHFDERSFENLGIRIKSHGKMPDVVVHFTDKNWLVIIEAVTSHGPVNPKRRSELKRLFRDCTAPLVYVTAFLNRRGLNKYLADIAWETEVWVAESPTHLIHFNGERFLGPYDD